MRRDHALTFACALALLHMGCNAIPENEPPDPDPPAQTEIVRVEVMPNPVAAGDTALFRAILEDSLDSRFKYTWHRDAGRFVGADSQFRFVDTDTNSIFWIAPQEPGEYRNSISVDNGSQDSLGVGKTFHATVVQES